MGAPGGDLLSRGQSALSSAQRRFTVLFGMGRRGSTSLWPPSKGWGGRPLSGLRPAFFGRSGFNNQKKYWVQIRQHKALQPLSPQALNEAGLVLPFPLHALLKVIGSSRTGN